jgi:hypothetical protein
MSKIDRDDFRETLTLLLSAHIASQTQNGIRALQDAKVAEGVMETASKLAIKIIDESKKYPKKKKAKNKNMHGSLIAIPQVSEVGSN